MKPTLCSALIAGLFAVNVHAAHAADAVSLTASGVDKAAVDAAVRPQDDFFRYSQGQWLKGTEIPNDRASWGAFNIAQENVEGQIRTRKWQDQSGHDRSSTEIHLTPYNGTLTFLDSKRDGGDAPPRREPARAGAGGGMGAGDMSDDVPFGPCWQ